MNRWIKTTGLSLSLLTALAAPAWASEPAPVPAPAAAAVAQSDQLTLSGPLTHVDLEGGYYAVDGWRLIGDESQLQSYLGQRVIVTGTASDAPSIQMVKALKVKSIVADSAAAPVIAPAPQVPTAVTVGGKPVTFDQGPALLDGVLMLPVRAIAEAGGGKVSWDGETQTVQIRMPDRSITLQIGNARAEMNQDGVVYLTRNLIAMAKAPTLLQDRTMISADALNAVFGFQLSTAADGTLALIPAAKVAAPQGTAPASPPAP